MTNEDYALLAEYKEQLHTALHSDYSRYVPRQVLKRMVEIVRGGNANYKMNPSCSRCVLSILKDAARLYEKEQLRLNSDKADGKARRKPRTKGAEDK